MWKKADQLLVAEKCKKHWTTWTCVWQKSCDIYASSSFEEYYHLCNNSCEGVIWTCAKSTETCETSWDVKEINGDEYGIECRINCQTESKISAADKMGRKKMKPYDEKNFLPRTLWNKSDKLNFFMKTRWEGQLKRSQKVQLYHMPLEHRF